MIVEWPQLGEHIALAVDIALALTTSTHALLTKPDPRGASGWIAVAWLFPIMGSLFYYVFGINRVHARAKRLRDTDGGSQAPKLIVATGAEGAVPALARIGDAITQWPRVDGNRLDVLHDGEDAFPAMLEAIARARRSVWLATYIFDTDETGHRFIEAVASAQRRGVCVRVMTDGIGELYGWPRAVSLLRDAGVRAERFLPPRLLPPTLYLNLRNHRKLLLVDGEVGFTGGMNISARHLAVDGRRRVTDLHFRVRGPVLAQLAEAFIADWNFVSGENLELPAAPPPAGDSVCRMILDGPDDNLDKLLLVIIEAISVARRQVLIMTPYFIPSVDLLAVLQAAALRGVDVTIVLPRRSDLRWVDWATRRWLPPLLERGVRIFMQPPPFAHTKLFVIDGEYAQIGSANMDPRSLRLNFEIVVEIYDAALCAQLAQHILDACAAARPVTLESLASVHLSARVRDSAFWLLSPYL
jgi:cardiolipin synthase